MCADSAGMPVADQQAIEIARRKRPTARELDQVYAWAEADPAPDKAQWLLLLQSGGYAWDRYLDGVWGGDYLARWPLPKLIARCAQADPAVLWRFAEHDFDPNRRKLAILSLLEMAGQEKALLDLAGRDLDLLEDDWKLIQACLAKRKVKVPVAIQAFRQEAWEAFCTSDSGGERYLAKVAAWPAEWRQTPPRSKPLTRPTAAYGTGTTDLTRHLNRIAAWYSGNAPAVVAGLAPGRTAEEIDRLTGPFKKVLPEELYELYRWREATPARPFFLAPGVELLSLEEAIEYYLLAVDTQSQPAGAFHFATQGAQESYFVVVSKAPAASGPVKRLFVQDPPAKRVCASLTEFFATVADEFESGAYRVDASGRLDDVRRAG